MADHTFTHKVSLQLKLADWDSLQDFEGCGEYDGIYQLNNVWMLHAINGKEISDNNRAAHLQFDISEGVFYGNGGCNNISGSIEHSETTITRSEEHTSELQSRGQLVCRLLLEKKKQKD